MRWLGAALLIFACMRGAARASQPHDANSGWVEARSPHFTVVSDASASQARNVAALFERVREVFLKAFPGMRVYPDLPILILAARGRTGFDALSPPAWAKQGQISRTGMMLRNPDENFILLLLNAPGENPYHVIYHEYAHLVLEDDFRNIPLWLNEGLAEFYGNSEINGKTVRLGLPSQRNLDLLRNGPWLPLTALFTIDQTSPYYNEEDKGTIFYAESWALTDYLMFVNGSQGQGPIDRYLALLAHQTGAEADPIAAATAAFGNLDDLLENLRSYVGRSSFRYYRLKVDYPANKNSYPIEPLSPAESEAVRGDFMARNGNAEAARTMLLDALRRDPKLASADQSMGLVEAAEQHEAEAKRWFAKAAGECAECALSRFYHAIALMQQEEEQPGSIGPPRQANQSTTRAAIQSGIEGLIQLNPTFAPAYAAMAKFDATSGGNLKAAREMTAEARKYDPRNVHYIFLKAEILMKMGDAPDALQAAHQAVAVAKSPADKSQAYILLGAIQQRLEAGHIR